MARREIRDGLQSKDASIDDAVPGSPPSPEADKPLMYGNPPCALRDVAVQQCFGGYLRIRARKRLTGVSSRPVLSRPVSSHPVSLRVVPPRVVLCRTYVSVCFFSRLPNSSHWSQVGRSTRQASFRRGTSFGFENVSSFDTRTSGSGGGGLAFPLSGDPNRKFSATSMPFRPSKADVARFLEAARSGEKEDEEVDSEAEGRVDEFMTSGQASPVRYPNGPGGSRGRAIHSGSIKRGGRGGRRVVKEESVKDFDVNKDDEIAKTAERLTRYATSIPNPGGDAVQQPSLRAGTPSRVTWWIKRNSFSI